MLASERYEKIKRLLEENGAVNVNDLMKLFNVSLETVRRDLLKMEQSKQLKRVHGGAVSVVQMKNFANLESRNKEMYKEKRELSETAAKFINENDYIAIDSGSTAIVFAEVLKERFTSLNVVTHSLDVFNALCTYKNFQVILVGGHFLANENAFYGSIVTETLSRLHVSKVFIFPSAVSIDVGICDYEHNLYEIQKKLIEIGDSVYILADSSKFEKKALYKLDDINPEYTYVTDKTIGNEILNIYNENGCKIYI